MRPHLRSHRRFTTIWAYISEPDSELIGGTAIDAAGGALEYQFAPGPDAPERPYLHITLSAPVGRRLTSEKWMEFIRETFAGLGLTLSSVPWIARRHTGTRCDHVHVLLLAQTWVGNWIEITRRREACDQIQRRLSRMLGLPDRSPQHSAASGFRIAKRTRRSKGDREAQLLSVIERAIVDDLPGSTEELQAALSRQQGGIKVREELNGHGVTSFRFEADGLRPVFGGALSPDLKPGDLRERLRIAAKIRSMMRAFDLLFLSSPASAFAPTTFKKGQVHDRPAIPEGTRNHQAASCPFEDERKAGRNHVAYEHRRGRDPFAGRTPPESEQRASFRPDGAHEPDGVNPRARRKDAQGGQPDSDGGPGSVDPNCPAPRALERRGVARHLIAVLRLARREALPRNNWSRAEAFLMRFEDGSEIRVDKYGLQATGDESIASDLLQRATGMARHGEVNVPHEAECGPGM